MIKLIDEKTEAYYSENALEIFERYDGLQESGIAEYFTSSFVPGCKVLDVGAGSGRDVRRLLELGFDAYGAEPTDKLRELAIQKHPTLKSRLFYGSLPDKITSYQKYDGVVCSAVLMHMPQNLLFDSVLALRDLLTENGRLLVSIPAQRPDIGPDFRDNHGRLFSPISADQLKLLCKRLALDCIAEHQNEDGLGRRGTAWHTLLFVRRSAAGKPLDRIESVLRNDRKTATYKLALMRGFCDIAEQDERAVRWNPDGTIGIPTMRIAELWLEYYWPLLATPVLIPQITSEAAGGASISFRKLLRDLIELSGEYFQIDDVASTPLYSMFMLAWKKGDLPEKLSQQLQATLKKIRTAIIQGPVQFASGGDMFSHDKGTDTIKVESELWLEFCLTGYWVRDSLIMRWAELCTRFGHALPHVTMGSVMERLLERPEVEREQSLARKVYSSQDNLSCVWSEKKLTAARMDVDHALPYSLWFNNDLWNLLPTDKQVNNRKRDKVPSNALLLSARDRIITNWQFAHRIESDVFEFEVARALGEFSPKYWEKPLFDHMKRKAEVAVFQRGAVVWDAVE